MLTVPQPFHNLGGGAPMNGQRGDGLRLVLLGRQGQQWPEDSQKARPKISPRDHMWRPRFRPLPTHVSVWQQVLHLEPDRGWYLGDCDVDKSSGNYDEDSQAGTQIADGCEGIYQVSSG
jgi:hypothetical protein